MEQDHYMTHLLNNENTVLWCSLFKINRYVAAPSEQYMIMTFEADIRAVLVSIKRNNRVLNIIYASMQQYMYICALNTYGTEPNEWAKSDNNFFSKLAGFLRNTFWFLKTKKLHNSVVFKLRTVQKFVVLLLVSDWNIFFNLKLAKAQRIFVQF